jgi:hypothetical protein
MIDAGPSGSAFLFVVGRGVTKPRFNAKARQNVAVTDKHLAPFPWKMRLTDDALS